MSNRTSTAHESPPIKVRRSFTVSPDLADRLRAQARDEDISEGAIVRRGLRIVLAEASPERARPGRRRAAR